MATQIGSYVPLLEGVPASLKVRYTFPPGFTASLSSVMDSILTLTGSNAYWQGRISLGVDSGGTYYVINYNGATLPLNEYTQMTLTSKNLAAASLSGSFDVFKLAGDSWTMKFYNIFMPTVASVQSTLKGGVAGQSVVVTLDRPLPPFQQGMTVTPRWTGNVQVLNTGIEPIMAASGWLSGWRLTVTPSGVSGTIAVNLGIKLNQTIPYLKGTGFVTEDVTYLDKVIASVSITKA